MLQKKLKVLFVSYEVSPFYKQGGLADVAGSLPKALKALGADMRIIMPYYESIKKNFSQIKKYKNNLQFEMNGKQIKINLLKSFLPASHVSIYFIDAPQYFQVKNIFDKKAKERFIFFSKIVVKILKNNSLAWQPQIIHNNDWQTGLVPLEAKLLNLDYKTIFTIHNIGYAGRTEIKLLEKFNFQVKNFSQIKKGKINIVREAILSAHKINTVSPTYAQEILKDKYGYDMADALRKRKKDLSGILNGIDTTLWNPQKDKFIKSNYSFKTIKNKVKNKLYLQTLAGLSTDKEIPLIGIISRLAGQKGFDILNEVFEKVMQLDLQMIILGTGAEEYEKFYLKMNRIYKHKFKAFIQFDKKLARQIYAGSDIFLMPSKYEPCGLGQLIAMRYGTIPVVRFTGGLKDTVKNLTPQRTNLNSATGFGFNKYNGQSVLRTVQRAIKIYHNEKIWLQLIQNVMQQDFSWHNSAQLYLKFYQALIKKNK